jgi:hypothetical protein
MHMATALSARREFELPRPRHIARLKVIDGIITFFDTTFRCKTIYLWIYANFAGALIVAALRAQRR